MWDSAVPIISHYQGRPRQMRRIRRRWIDTLSQQPFARWRNDAESHCAARPFTWETREGHGCACEPRASPTRHKGCLVSSCPITGLRPAGRRDGHTIVAGCLMTRWTDFAADQPDFAQRVQRLFKRQKHMTLATLRRDGSPRISGTEVEFDAEELVLGMMPGSRKALDLAARRAPRLAQSLGRPAA